ncbi:MAG: family transposase [Gemmataceae bacterium]|nr:family transposase [Gemmataceae bacterium]
MSYAFIEPHRDEWPVLPMCDALGVSPAGYYAWRDRDTSRRDQRREKPAVEIRAIHTEVRARYGSPRVHAGLVDRGHDCGVDTVARITRDAGIAAKTMRKFRPTTNSNHALPVAENVLDRQFDPPARNASWVADITFIPTREGWPYLAAVEDLFSRLVVGRSVDATMTSRLVVDAREVAVVRRLPGSGLVAHSDRGTQSASDHYRRLLGSKGITCGMSRRGNCRDNAPMDSFFASLKKESVHDEDYATREQARASIFEYIETFYNRVRRHSALGYQSPTDYEASHPAGPLTPCPFFVGNSKCGLPRTEGAPAPGYCLRSGSGPGAPTAVTPWHPLPSPHG